MDPLSPPSRICFKMSSFYVIASSPLRNPTFSEVFTFEPLILSLCRDLWRCSPTSRNSLIRYRHVPPGMIPSCVPWTHVLSRHHYVKTLMTFCTPGVFCLGEEALLRCDVGGLQVQGAVPSRRAFLVRNLFYGPPLQSPPLTQYVWVRYYSRSLVKHGYGPDLGFSSRLVSFPQVLLFPPSHGPPPRPLVHDTQKQFFLYPSSNNSPPLRTKHNHLPFFVFALWAPLFS